MGYAYKSGVKTIKKTGAAALTGDVTLTAGANVTLTESGQDITIASSAGAAGGTPALVLSTANAAGVATTFIREDDTIAVFDTTVPVTQAYSDAAATGVASVAARRDHRHGMPAAGGGTTRPFAFFGS